MLVGNLRVDNHGKGNILTVATDISHKIEGVAFGVAVWTAQVWEIIFIRVVPCKRYVRVCVDNTGSSRPAFVGWVVTIH